MIILSLAVGYDNVFGSVYTGSFYRCSLAIKQACTDTNRKGDIMKLSIPKATVSLDLSETRDHKAVKDYFEQSLSCIKSYGTAPVCPSRQG